MNTTSRANFLPEQRFLPLRPALQEHLTKVGQAISPENFLSICDEMLLKVLRETFERISADEGSIWLLDQERKRPPERPGISRRGHEFAEIVAVISRHDEQAGIPDAGG